MGRDLDAFSQEDSHPNLKKHRKKHKHSTKLVAASNLQKFESSNKVDTIVIDDAVTFQERAFFTSRKKKRRNDKRDANVAVECRSLANDVQIEEHRDVLNGQNASSHSVETTNETKRKKTKLKSCMLHLESTDAVQAGDIDITNNKSSKKRRRHSDHEMSVPQFEKGFVLEIKNPVREKKNTKALEKCEWSSTRSDAAHVGNMVQPSLDDTSTEVPNVPVNISGSGCHEKKFRPIKTFDKLQLPENILSCCKKFNKPTPIQAHAWPFLLEGRNLIGIAATGSGKTLAFGVPALVHARKKNTLTQKRRGPACLVLAPTRELAQQIADVLVEAGKLCGVKTACIYGGVSKKPQISTLKSSVDIIVATPGRLQDLLSDGACKLNDISFLVVDEADRMLDFGFEPAVRAIVSQISKVRQAIMFSATWPPAVNQLSKEFMQQDCPIKVVIGSEDLAANHDVTQIVQVLEDRARDARLIALLDQYHKSQRNQVLVFVLYKKEAVRVETFLQRRGWRVSSVHGDKRQADRTRAVTSFKDGTCPLLIATDVAARGLDIPDVEYVINYSFPLTTEDYVHRIGRTGRAGKKGIAHTFFTQADKARAGELVNVLREAGQNVPLDLLKFGTHTKRKESEVYGVHFKELTADAPKAIKITFDSDDDAK